MIGPWFHLGSHLFWSVVYGISGFPVNVLRLEDEYLRGLGSRAGIDIGKVRLTPLHCSLMPVMNFSLASRSFLLLIWILLHLHICVQVLLAVPVMWIYRQRRHQWSWCLWCLTWSMIEEPWKTFPILDHHQPCSTTLVHPQTSFNPLNFHISLVLITLELILTKGYGRTNG